MRLPSSNIWRRLLGALSAGLALGLVCYGLLVAVRRLPTSSPMLELVAALGIGLLIGVCLFLAGQLVLRLAVYDLRHAAAALTDEPISTYPVYPGSGALPTLHSFFERAIALRPDGQLQSDIAEVIAAAPDVGQRFTVALARVAQDLPVLGAVLFFYDAERATLVPALRWGALAQLPLEPQPASEGTLQRVLHAAVITVLVGAQARLLLPLVDAQPVVCVPLHSATEIIGLLCLLGDADDVVWADQRRAVVRGLGAQFTLVVQEARLTQALALERKQLMVVATLASELPQEMQRDQALERVLRAIESLTGSEHGTLLLLDHDEQVAYRVSLNHNNLVPLQLVARSVLRNGLAGWALRERRSDIIADTATDSRWVAVPGLGDIRSALVVPLLLGERALGVLTLASTRPDNYTQRHLLLASAVAAQALHILALEDLATPPPPPLCLEGHLPQHAIDALERDAALALLTTPRSSQAVVLAAGIGSFARLCEQLAPQDLFEQLIEPFMVAFRSAVYQNGGYIDRCDGAMALAAFGYPFADDDAPVRALAAAMQLRSAIQPLRRAWRSLAEADIVPGIAVASGVVTTGRVGADASGSYVLLGPATILAQRLQTLARPAEVLCTTALADACMHTQPVELGLRFEPLSPLPTLPPAEQPCRLLEPTEATFAAGIRRNGAMLASVQRR